MKRILELKKTISGQWIYRVVGEDGAPLIAWQYGSENKEETVSLAKGRFFINETKTN